MSAPLKAQVKVRFRIERLDEKFADLGITSYRAQALYLGAKAHTVVSKLHDRRNPQQPSLEFLRLLRRAWPSHDTDYWLDYGDDAPAVRRRRKAA